MPDSPIFRAGFNTPFIVEVLANGKIVSNSWDLDSIEVERAMFRIPGAMLVYRVDVEEVINPSRRSIDKIFYPGIEVEIKAGYENQNKDTLFKGILVNQGLRYFKNRVEMTLHCTDKAFHLSQNRNSRHYQNVTDSDIFQTLAAEAGLASDIEPTAGQHREMVQYDSTDWDFMLLRAAANGLFAYATDGKVFLKKPASQGSPVMEIRLDGDVTDFDIQINAHNQIPAARRAAWDPTSQSMRTAKASEPPLNKQGNIVPGELGGRIGLGESRRATPASLPAQEVKAWADAGLVTVRNGFFQGTITFFGNAQARLNTLVLIKGFGERFDGSALVTGVRHHLGVDGWRSSVTLGVATENPAETLAPIPGLVPPTAGLQIGIVEKLEADPSGEHRILVQLPAIAPDGDGIWARLSQFYATAGKGAYFLPEIGDEVVLGFLHDDPRYPVVLGSLYSSHRQPPYAAEDDNKIKAIVTKNNFRIEINEEEKTLSIQTPDGNQIDINGQGISLHSAKDIVLKASGQIKLDAAAGLTANAAGNLLLEAAAIQAKARASFTAEGGAQATLSSDGQTTVKGAMVLIN